MIFPINHQRYFFYYFLDIFFFINLDLISVFLLYFLSIFWFYLVANWVLMLYEQVFDNYILWFEDIWRSLTSMERWDIFCQWNLMAPAPRTAGNMWVWGLYSHHQRCWTSQYPGRHVFQKFCCFDADYYFFSFFLLRFSRVNFIIIFCYLE
jgi:hypothetical protein